MTASALMQENSFPQRIDELPPELPALTKKQIECLTFIFHYRLRNKTPPTEAEIAEALSPSSSVKHTNGKSHISRQAARGHIESLVKKRCLMRDTASRWRALRLTQLGLDVLNHQGAKDEQQLDLFVDPRGTNR